MTRYVRLAGLTLAAVSSDRRIGTCPDSAGHRRRSRQKLQSPRYPYKYPAYASAVMTKYKGE